MINIPVNGWDNIGKNTMFLFLSPILSVSCSVSLTLPVFCFVLAHTHRRWCATITTCRLTDSTLILILTLSQRVLLLYFLTSMICDISYKNNNHNDNVTAITKTMSKTEYICVFDGCLPLFVRFITDFYDYSNSTASTFQCPSFIWNTNVCVHVYIVWCVLTAQCPCTVVYKHTHWGHQSGCFTINFKEIFRALWFKFDNFDWDLKRTSVG